MKKFISVAVGLLLLTAPVLSGCESKLKLENEQLKKEIETLTMDKRAAEAKLNGTGERLEECTKANKELQAKLDESKRSPVTTTPKKSKKIRYYHN